MPLSDVFVIRVGSGPPPSAAGGGTTVVDRSGSQSGVWDGACPLHRGSSVCDTHTLSHPQRQGLCRVPW